MAIGTPKADVTGGINTIVTAKKTVRFATDAALDANTYDNGPLNDGVGATITADVNGIMPDVDGVTPVVDDRLLVKDEAAGLKNGFYLVTSVGSAGSKWVLTRVEDADENAEVGVNTNSFISEGTVNEDTLFSLTTDGVIDIGTTALTFDPAAVVVVPGGADTQLQFNDSGSFGADSNLTWNNTDKRLSIGGATSTGRLNVKGIDGVDAITVFASDDTLGYLVRPHSTDGTIVEVHDDTGAVGVQLRGKAGAGNSYFLKNDVAVGDAVATNTLSVKALSGGKGIDVTSNSGGLRFELAAFDTTGRFRIKDGSSVDKVEFRGDSVGNYVVNGNTGFGLTVANEKIEVTGNVRVSGHYKVGTDQVVGARKAGWAIATGTATRTTFATFAGQTITNPPTQAEVQAIDDHVKILSERMKATIDDLHSTAGHGLFGA